MKAREILSRSKVIKSVYRKASHYFVKALIKTSPILATKYLHKRTTRKKLNLKNPVDFNEKLQWLKLYWQHPLVYRCADKYEVRSYIEEAGCPEILNDLYHVYNRVDEICWDVLPDSFVLKTTNSCGTNIICSNKSELNKEETISKLRKWMKIDYSYYAAELHYSKIIPRIVCEKYLNTEAGFLPNDYKIYCFNGFPKIILVATDRAVELRLFFVDLNWRKIDIGSNKYNLGEPPEKPECLGKMLSYAETLSKPFPFVRIDFYNVNNHPVFGEMTFTPAGNMAMYYNEYGLKFLGDMLTLPRAIN